MTLRELSVRLKGELWQRRHEAKSAIRLAWNIAALIRQKELPNIDDLLMDHDKGAESRAKLQRAAWIDWAIAHGVAIVRHERPVM